MPRAFHLAAGALLVFAAAAIGCAADRAFDDGRLIDRLSGRTGVEAACLSELLKGLSAEGFAPSEVVFGTQARPGLPFWPRRAFKSDFSFEDGPAATRIDGIMACIVGRGDVRVEFRTDARPVRAS